MGRPPRPLGAGVTYHVFARGNGRSAIYMDDVDRELFITVLGRTVFRYGWTVHAYCLMTNHFHLTLTTRDADLHHGMRDLQSGYARSFNRRHQRSGHLFGTRYGSVVVTSDRQLMAALRYVHRNPLAAGLVDTPSRWPWSSFPVLLRLNPAPKFFDIDAVLGWLAEDRDLATRALRLLVEDADAHDLRDDEPLRPWTPRRQPADVAPPILAIIAALGPVEGAVACIDNGHRIRDVATALGITESALSRRLRSPTGGGAP